MYFFFNDTATTEIYTLSLHDALPISQKESNISHTASESVENNDNSEDDINAEILKYKTSLDLSKINTYSRLQFNENISHQKRMEIAEYKLFLVKELQSIIKSFQRYEKRYSQKENFGKFRQEAQKIVDKKINKILELTRRAKENPNGFNFNFRGDPSIYGDIKLSIIDNDVKLLSINEKMEEAFNEYDEKSSKKEKPKKTNLEPLSVDQMNIIITKYKDQRLPDEKINLLVKQLINPQEYDTLSKNRSLKAILNTSYMDISRVEDSPYYTILNRENGKYVRIKVGEGSIQEVFDKLDTILHKKEEKDKSSQDKK